MWIDSKRSLVTANGPHARSESRSSSGPPEAHGPLAGPAAGGAKVGMRRRVGPLRVAQLLRPAYGPRSQEIGKNGLAAGGAEMRMRRREASAARPRPVVPVGPTAHGRRCRFVQRRAAAAWPAHGPRSQLVPRPAVPRGACGLVPVMRSRRWRSESGWAVRYGPW